MGEQVLPTSSINLTLAMRADQKTARTIKLLGFGGLLPFVSLLVIIVFGSDKLSDKAAESMLYYAAVILTFLGAVHWGSVLVVANNSSVEQKRLWWAITPSLIAWVALMLPIQFSIVVLMLAFVLCWWMDKILYDQTEFTWYIKMRLHLTIVVVTSLVLLLLFS